MKGTSPSRASRLAAVGDGVARWDCRILINSPWKGKSMSMVTLGIDLAKNIFAVHGVNENGHAALVKPKVSRE